MQDQNGGAITDQRRIVERWVEYLEELLKSVYFEAHMDSCIMNSIVPGYPNEQPTSIQEILDTINHKENCKPPGVDNIKAKLLKTVSTLFIERIHQLTTFPFLTLPSKYLRGL